MQAIKIDAHQHFWKYHPQDHAWIDDTMQVIRRDFLPVDLVAVLAAENISGCVAVQADQSEAETEFLIGLAAENKWIKAVVGWVDLRAENIEERLAYYKQFPVVKGFRHILQSEEPAFMLHADFIRGIAALEKFGYSYDILIYPRHLTAAMELVQQFPNTRFVIDHMAKPYIKDGLLRDWKQGMMALAANSNLYCKVSGMVTEADWLEWKEVDFIPYLDAVVAAFGVERLMFGSDWPVCLLAADYPKTIALVRDYFSNFSEEEQAMFFGKNALEFYQI